MPSNGFSGKGAKTPARPRGALAKSAGSLTNPFMPPRKSPDSSDAILVNKLTVRDATHLVKVEGGSLSPRQIVFRAATIIVIAAFTARAIVVGQATAWHLFLPMVGEYLVLLLSLPVIRLIVRDEALGKDAKKSLHWLAAIVVITASWIGSQALEADTTWWAQAKTEGSRFFTWITSHQMHWPILGAMAAMIAGLPGRVAAFHRHGPPFMAVGMGCAMRLIIPLFGCFLVPFIAAGKIPIVWLIWTILLLSELVALYMHWDLQRRLANRGIEV